jgi:aryl-alcohol dehydrogenase-like predicted oxidoreductase
LWPDTRYAGRAILDLVRQHQVPLLGWAGQARGYFAGATELIDGNADPFATAANERRRAHCRFVAREHGIAPETVALAWSLHVDGILPVIGARTLAELDASMAAAALDLEPGTQRWLVGDDKRFPGVLDSERGQCH